MTVLDGSRLQHFFNHPFYHILLYTRVSIGLEVYWIRSLIQRYIVIMAAW